MELKQVAQRLDDAAEMLPANLSALVRGLPCGVKAQVREIRLRAAKPLAINVANEDLFLLHNGALVHEVESGVVVVSGKEVDECFQRLCDYSVYSHHSEIVGGFITVRNGHRAGLCGTAVVEGGRVTGVRGISSINLRVAREIPGAADEVMRRVFADEVKGMLLCGVPGSGKTTLLRDIAKQLSQRGLRVSVADERGELAAVYCGQAGNDLGPRCDVLDGYPKGEGIMIAVRCLAPDVVVCDEIGSEQETREIFAGLNCGVAVIASVHAATRQELCKKTQIMRLIQAGAFPSIVFLRDAKNPCAIGEVVSADELYHQGGRRGMYHSNLFGGWHYPAPALDRPGGLP